MGHTSTQIYTHVALNKLKEIHAATHPARATRVETDTRYASTSTPELDALWTALAVENDDAE